MSNNQQQNSSIGAWKKQTPKGEVINFTINGQRYNMWPNGKKTKENQPDFKQNGTIIAAFGSNTCKAVTDAGLTLHIQVPAPNIPSMVSGLDQFLGAQSKKK